MARVNILKQIKMDGCWTLRSIPRKAGGGWDWQSLPEGGYYIEWRENGKRIRESVGRTACQALEAQRIKKAELAALRMGILRRRRGLDASDQPVSAPISFLINRYLEHTDVLKKPNTYCKYRAVLRRFEAYFPDQKLSDITTEQLNDFVVQLKRSGMSANTVLHNVIIVAQFFKRNGRPNITRSLQLPEAARALPREYSDEDLSQFLGGCNGWEDAIYSTFLLTGLREQEVMHLYWSDINFNCRTLRVTSKPDLRFFPKRWEEREVPVPTHLIQLLARHPRIPRTKLVFPSSAGNREQNFLRRCKDISERVGLDPAQFDLKTFRSTYATRMLRFGFDVRTVQHWLGHKSLETTMRYLVPSKDVLDRLDSFPIPGKSPRDLDLAKEVTLVLY